jgi:hypothetical protein
MKNEFEKITPQNMFASGDLKILICYLLATLNEPVPSTETCQLFHYEGITNYFDAQTAIYELEKDGYIALEDKNRGMYEITDKGRNLSNTLKDTVSIALKDKVYKAVLKMLSRYKSERDTNIVIEKTESGSLLSCKVTNNDEVLFAFQLLLPNDSQAEALKDKILEDPKYYYDSFINILTEDIEKIK